MFPSILISTNKRSWDDCHDDSDLTVVAKWVLEQAEALLEKRHTIKWSKIVIKQPEKSIEITSLKDTKTFIYSEFSSNPSGILQSSTTDDAESIKKKLTDAFTASCMSKIIDFSVVRDDSDSTDNAEWVLEQAEALLEKRHTIKWSKIVIKEPQKHIEITSLEDKIKYSEFKPGQRDVILEYDHDIHDMNKIHEEIHEEIHKDLTRAFKKSQIIYFSVVFTRYVCAS